jgi:hypothetical protein
VLADIIFNAPSTPTQPLQANLHPVATAEKKKEIKKKETRKVADPKSCNIRLCVLLKLKFSSKKKWIPHHAVKFLPRVLIFVGSSL